MTQTFVTRHELLRGALASAGLAISSAVVAASEAKSIYLAAEDSADSEEIREAFRVALPSKALPPTRRRAGI